jgi:hypothetical protein
MREVGHKPMCKGKSKVHPITGHEGSRGEKRYSSTLSLTSALDGCGCSTPRSVRFNPLEHSFFTQKMISRSIYNLKIDTICMCDIQFDRSILQLSNGTRHVVPSTDRMLELTAKHRWLSRLTAGCVFQWVNPGKVPVPIVQEVGWA